MPQYKVSRLSSIVTRRARVIGFFLMLAAAGCAGGPAHVKRGDSLVRSGLHEQALAEYEQAAQEDPADPAVQAKIAETRKALAANAAGQAQAAILQKDFSATVEALKKAIEYDEENKEYRKVLKKAADDLLAEAKKLLADKKFAQAIEVIQKVLKELPKYAPARQAQQEVEQAWAAVLYEEAKKVQQNKLWGSSLLFLVQLRKLVGAYSDSATREISAREQLQEAAVFEVTVKPANVPKRWLEGTANLARALREVKVARCPSFAVASSGPARVTLSVGLEGVTFAQTRENTPATQKYQSGTRKVDNPKYLELKQKISETQAKITEIEKAIQEDTKAIEELRDKYADAGPDDDESAMRGRMKAAEKQLADHRHGYSQNQAALVQLRADLSKTPKKLDEPVYDEHAYEVSKVIRTGTAVAKASARSEEGGNLFNQTASGSASTSDTTNPALPKFSVKADPLEFPKSDPELTAEALSDVAGKIGEMLNDGCQKWRDGILARARQASADAPAEALEDYVLYLFVEPGPPPAEVVEYLKQKRDFTDIPMLLGRESKPEAAKEPAKKPAEKPAEKLAPPPPPP